MRADQERFAELYGALYPRVLAYALHRVAPDQAYDAVDEAFLIAWRKRRTLRRGAELPWLLITVRNVLANHHRRDRRQDAVATEIAASVETDAASGPEASVVERVSVLSALASLSEQQREALILTAWDGLSSRAAAEVAGCSSIAFGVRLHRARRRFTAALARADDRVRANGHTAEEEIVVVDGKEHR